MKHSNKAQSKPDKQQCQLLWAEIQATPSNGTVTSKDGKRYIRSKP